MSAPHIILDNLQYLCQKFSDLVEVRCSYIKNDFASFSETRCRYPEKISSNERGCGFTHQLPQLLCH